MLIKKIQPMRSLGLSDGVTLEATVTVRAHVHIQPLVMKTSVHEPGLCPNRALKVDSTITGAYGWITSPCSDWHPISPFFIVRSEKSDAFTLFRIFGQAFHLSLFLILERWLADNSC